MENDLLIQPALEKLNDYTGLGAKWEPGELDGTIKFRYNNEFYTAYVEAKNEFRNHQLGAIEKLKNQYQPLLLIARHIFPKMKDELRRQGIGYLETDGNVFFKDRNLLLWIEGQKGEPRETTKLGRAFTRTGLKLVFEFLQRPELINMTYREIAVKTKFLFGNINFIMTDLKEQGYLLPANKDTYALNKGKELLEKWMATYEDKLKPTLHIGTFKFINEPDFTNWKALNPAKGTTFWGGEPAGDILTNYLKPQELTLYTTERRLDLIKNYRLIPDPKGNIKIYQKFWNGNDTPGDKTVPPLLVYTDLMNTGDRRCIQTAEKIYDKYLQDKF